MPLKFQMYHWWVRTALCVQKGPLSIWTALICYRFWKVFAESPVLSLWDYYYPLRQFCLWIDHNHKVGTEDLGHFLYQSAEWPSYLFGMWNQCLQTSRPSGLDKTDRYGVFFPADKFFYTLRSVTMSGQYKYRRNPSACKIADELWGLIR